MCDRPIDWFAVISELQRRTVTIRVIARKLGRAPITVQSWMHGTEPRHSDGEHVIDLWCARTANVRNSLPRVGETPERSPVAAKDDVRVLEKDRTP